MEGFYLLFSIFSLWSPTMWNVTWTEWFCFAEMLLNSVFQKSIHEAPVANKICIKLELWAQIMLVMVSSGDKYCLTGYCHHPWMLMTLQLFIDCSRGYNVKPFIITVIVQFIIFKSTCSGIRLTTLF